MKAKLNHWHRRQADSEMSNRYLVDEIPDKPWAGQRCFIIGGGKSLTGFDFETLRGENIIAINRAVEYAPFAEIMFSMDSRLYTWYKGRGGRKLPDDAYEKFNAYRGLRIWTDHKEASFENDVLLVKFIGCNGLLTSLREGIYTGGNSGYAAIQLAVGLGSKEIYLLGYDMDKKGNFHSGYPSGTNGDPEVMGWIEGMNKLAPKLEAAGIQVINMNPKSKLRCFPFGEFKLNTRKGKWKVISFYTEGTGYADEIKNLELSLKSFDIPYKIYKCQPLGSWRRNLNYKSKCILRAMKDYPQTDIVFIDADGIVRQYPKLFDELTASGAYDIAASFHRFQKQSGDTDELLSGTLWIQNCQSAKEIIEKWHEIGMEQSKIRHQKCLKLAIDELGKRDKLFRMPYEYTYVFDYQYHEKRDPVIEHFQASRRFRHAVGFGVDMINGQTQ